MAYLLSSPSEDKPLPPPSPPPSLAVFDIGAVQRVIAAATCSAITIEKTTDEVAGIVRLSGRVKNKRQGERVVQQIRDLPGVNAVEVTGRDTDTFDFLDWPFCEVIDLLNPIRQEAESRRAEIQIDPRKGCDADYFKAEELIIDVKTQEDLPYIYVDYFVADKEHVAHLLPHKRLPNNKLSNQRSLTIGGERSPTRWQIEPPFGLELVTVIASDRRLSFQPSLEPERAKAYLRDLDDALSEGEIPANIAADYCFITTKPNRE